MNPRPSLVFVCDTAPDSRAPHHHMAAAWLSRGAQVLCVCPAPAGQAEARSFGTPLGPVPARFIPLPGRGAAVGCWPDRRASAARLCVAGSAP